MSPLQLRKDAWGAETNNPSSKDQINKPEIQVQPSAMSLTILLRDLTGDNKASRKDCSFN